MSSTSRWGHYAENLMHCPALRGLSFSELQKMRFSLL